MTCITIEKAVNTDFTPGLELLGRIVLEAKFLRSPEVHKPHDFLVRGFSVAVPTRQ